MKYVPIPEVNEFSEVIEVGELGLPVGFDLGRLEMNVSGIERICRVGGIGHLAIDGFRGESTQYSYGATGVSPDGTASFTGSVGITRASLSDGEIDNDDNVPYDYRWSDAQVKINNREVEEKIRSDGDKWPLDVFDAGGRAKYMNRALQTGLINAATQVTYEGRPAVPATMWSLAKFSVITAGYKYGFDFTTEQAAGVYLAFVNGLSGLQHLAVKKDEDYKRLGEPKRLWTASPYIRYDRFTASVAMSANSKLIRESKVKS